MSLCPLAGSELPAHCGPRICRALSCRIGKVLFDDTGLYIREEGRMDAEILTHMEVEEIKDKFKGEVQIALDRADAALVNAIDEMDCKVEEAVEIINDKLADALDDAHAVNAETRELLESAAEI